MRLISQCVAEQIGGPLNTMWRTHLIETLGFALPSIHLFTGTGTLNA